MNKIILDCDTGADEISAFAWLHANPEHFSLLSVIVSNGVCPLHMAVENTQKLMSFFHISAPIFVGMERPILRENCFLPEIYQLSFDTDMQDLPSPSKEHFLFALYKQLMELSDGEQIDYIVTGPLTNLGLLLCTFPEVHSKIRTILFAGGAISGGDMTSSAEFNAYKDPEAAKIVFQSGIPIVLCSLDAAFKCTLTRHQILKLCQSHTPSARLCGNAAGRILEATSNKYRGAVSLHSVLPLLYLCQPEIFTFKKAFLDIDCSDGISRGHTICNFRWWEQKEEDCTTIVLTDADSHRFQEAMITALYDL